MSILFRLLLFFTALLTFSYIIVKIRRNHLRIEDSVFWFVFMLIIMVLSVFPDLAIICAKVLKIQSPVNFVYLCIIFILIMKMFAMALKMSRLEHKINELTIYEALRENEENNGNNENNDFA